MLVVVVVSRRRSRVEVDVLLVRVADRELVRVAGHADARVGVAVGRR